MLTAIEDSDLSGANLALSGKTNLLGADLRHVGKLFLAGTK